MKKHWAIKEAVDVRSRVHFNSAIPKFAQFVARLEPSSVDHIGIQVLTQWETAEDNRWLGAVQEGVDQFVLNRAEQEKPVAKTTLVMRQVISHPLVTNEATVSCVVRLTLQANFEKHESILGIDI